MTKSGLLLCSLICGGVGVLLFLHLWNPISGAVVGLLAIAVVVWLDRRLR